MDNKGNSGILSFNRLRIDRIWMLAKTEYIQRYYGSSLGVLWALLNPLARILIYYFTFTYLIFRNRESDFILYLFLGIVAWSYFSENTNKGLKLLQQKKYLIQNIEINKADIFLASALSTAFSFFLNIVVYLIFSAFFDVEFSYQIIYLILLFITLYVVVTGASMVLSCVYLYFRDLKHIWDLVLLAGFWSIPIFWPYKYVFTHYPILLYGNPLTGILINLRYILLYNQPIDWQVFLYDLGYAVVILLAGLFALKKFSHKAVETN